MYHQSDGRQGQYLNNAVDSPQRFGSNYERTDREDHPFEQRTPRAHQNTAVNGAKLTSSEAQNVENNARYANAPKETRRAQGPQKQVQLMNQSPSYLPQSTQVAYANGLQCQQARLSMVQGAPAHSNQPLFKQGSEKGAEPGKSMPTQDSRPQFFQQYPHQQNVQDPTQNQTRINEPLQELPQDANINSNCGIHQRLSEGQQPIRTNESTLMALPRKHRVDQVVAGECPNPAIIISNQIKGLCICNEDRDSDMGASKPLEPRRHGQSDGATVSNQDNRLQIGAQDCNPPAIIEGGHNQDQESSRRVNAQNNQKTRKSAPYERSKQAISSGAFCATGCGQDHSFAKRCQHKLRRYEEVEEKETEHLIVSQSQSEIQLDVDQSQDLESIPFEKSNIMEDNNSMLNDFESPLNRPNQNSTNMQKRKVPQSRKQKHNKSQSNVNSQNIPPQVATLEHDANQLVLQRTGSQIMTRSKTKQYQSRLEQQQQIDSSQNGDIQIPVAHHVKSSSRPTTRLEQAQQPDQRPSSSMFHPAEKPGQTGGSQAEDLDDEEPRPEDDAELEAQPQAEEQAQAQDHAERQQQIYLQQMHRQTFSDSEPANQMMVDEQDVILEESVYIEPSPPADQTYDAEMSNNNIQQVATQNQIGGAQEVTNTVMGFSPMNMNMQQPPSRIIMQNFQQPQYYQQQQQNYRGAPAAQNPSRFSQQVVQQELQQCQQHILRYPAQGYGQQMIQPHHHPRVPQQQDTMVRSLQNMQLGVNASQQRQPHHVPFVPQQQELRAVRATSNADIRRLEDSLRPSHFAWMLQAERKYPVDTMIISSEQQNINVQAPMVQSRAMCVDRLIQLQNYYSESIKEETLFLTVYLMDKYLENRLIANEAQLDLLSVTALYTAGKYEDIWPPKLDTVLANLQPTTFSKQTVKAMELELLNTVQFELNVPTPLRFLEFMLAELELEECQETKDFCRFVLDMALLELSMQQYTPSVLAAATLRCAAQYMRNHFGAGRGPNVEAVDSLITRQRLNRDDILIVAPQLTFDIPRCFSSHFTAYRVKYAGKWFMPQQQVPAGSEQSFSTSGSSYYHHHGRH